MIEKEVIEITLSDDNIDELILALRELKDSAQHIHFETGDKELLIHHKEDELL